MMLALISAALIVSAPVNTAPTEAGAVVDRMHASASVADGEVFFDTFTPDARFIGTDTSERWTIEEFRAYAMPHFSQGRGWTYRVVDRDIALLDTPCQCVAVFDEVLNNDRYGQVRGSGVVVKQGDAWRIQQYVLSFSIPNEKAAAVVDVIKAN